MSETPRTGFDFLQSLGQQTAQQMSQLPHVGQWMTPTMDVQELDKRINELKTVQFWLEQNTAALKSGIQALEVQKMTLAALKEMQFQFVPEQSQTTKDKTAQAANTVDPQMWWNALTQQFQTIANNVMGETASPPKAKNQQKKAAPLNKPSAATSAKNKQVKPR